jgi:uncharacterized cupin superfamily protein
MMIAFTGGCCLNVEKEGEQREAAVDDAFYMPSGREKIWSIFLVVNVVSAHGALLVPVSS